MVKDQSDTKLSKFFLIFGICLILLAIMLFFLSLLKGEKKYTRSNLAVETTKSVTCNGKEINYPFFTAQNADSRELEIIAIFGEKETIDTISLSYNLSFDSPSKAESASTSNSISLSKSFSNDNLSSGYFDDKFSTVGSNSIFRIIADNKILNGITAKYFLLDGISPRFSVEAITAEYNKKGLDCVINR